MKGNIFDIKRFAVHDGPGIHTTVFFKGCPLRCVWCHNPEGLSAKPQLAYYAHTCVGCGCCVSGCPVGAHTLDAEHIHRFDRAKCLSCGKCVSTCYNGALSLFGRTVTVEELLPELLADRDFYESSGGGITLSGGECLVQPEFSAALLRAAKEEYGLSTAVESTACAPYETVQTLLPYLDWYLMDIKHTNPEKHKAFTGRDNALILENAKKLARDAKNLVIRVPVIPTFNDAPEEILSIARFAASLGSVKQLHLLPYHRLGYDKYVGLGRDYGMGDVLPPDARKMAILKGVAESTGLEVQIGG